VLHPKDTSIKGTRIEESFITYRFRVKVHKGESFTQKHLNYKAMLVHGPIQVLALCCSTLAAPNQHTQQSHNADLVSLI